MGRRLSGVGIVISASVAVLAAILTPVTAADACANEAIRSDQSSTLPECRAYEKVTPGPKGSGEPEPTDLGEMRVDHDLTPLLPSHLLPPNGARAGLGGMRMAWISEPLPGARAPGVSHLASRGSAGWTSEDLVPPMSPFNDLLCPVILGVSAWSADLSRSVLDLPAGAPQGFHQEEECGNDEPRLVAGEPDRFRNLFVHDNLGGSNQLVNVTPDGVVWPEPEEDNQLYWPASFLAGSDDLSHVVFEEELALIDDAPVGYPGGNELYEWSAGQVRLVTILPDGTSVHGVLAGATRNYSPESIFTEEQTRNIAQFRHAVSADGSRVFFEAAGGLYLREGSAETVQIDESNGPGADGGGRFMFASADGSKAFFLDESQLTPDSTAVSGAPDLYEYDVDSGETEDLTVAIGEPADVLGVSGGSDDGSRIYFVARGALSEEANSAGEAAIGGEPNLYVVEGGETRFVATLDEAADECDWMWNVNCGGGGFGSGLTARVSTDGQFLGFNSIRSLTGYDNTDASSGEPDIEIFLYDAGTNSLHCASCDPSEAQPTAGAAIHWPSNPGNNNNWDNAYPQRNVSDRGQVFFETADALLSQDRNGRRDVYEYVAGELHLISTGSSEASSHFLDATPDGSDVLLSTAQRLLPSDTDDVYDYYDARVDGGFAEPSAALGPCGAGSCRPEEPSQPATVVPGSGSFTGPGNVRRHGRCHASKHRSSHRGRHRPRRCGHHKRRVAS
jgi:hypothetical protein